MSDVESDKIEAFLEEAFLMVEETKNYIIENPNGRLSTIDHKRFLIEQMTKIIYLAEENLKEIREKSESRVNIENTITKEEVSKMLDLHNELTMTELKKIKQDISDIKKMTNRCNLDQNKESEIRNKLKSEITELIQANTEKTMEEILTVKGGIKDLNDNLHKGTSVKEQKISYSEVLKLGKTQPEVKIKTSVPQYTVLVYSKNKGNTSEDTKQILIKEINPVHLGIGIKGLRKINQGGVAIDLYCTEDMNTMAKELIKVKELTTKTSQKRLPRIKLVSVPKSIKQEEILDMLYEQNECFNTNISQKFVNEEITVKFSLPQKDQHCVSWVLEVTPMFREMIIKEGTINLGWARCPVFDFISIKRCFKCLGFGHFANQCPSKETTCSHCGDAHLYRECPKDKDVRCANCYRNKQTDYKHNTLDKSCPSYINELRKYS
ncbi:uncharacterized protein LOC111622951 [Centruroides sculpturatus]|uniref:uncharacterized protein LOC111622951 n=1 Tax=Centruroides sculpturatus TaxID=218467 RepID=UPI000C6E03DD|nr:uncharacterized protein LOC111622951 [Centruroides sculpturatus]